MQPIGCTRAIYICSAARNLVSATLKKNYGIIIMEEGTVSFTRS